MQLDDSNSQASLTYILGCSLVVVYSLETVLCTKCRCQDFLQYYSILQFEESSFPCCMTPVEKYWPNHVKYHLLYIYYCVVMLRQQQGWLCGGKYTQGSDAWVFTPSNRIICMKHVFDPIPILSIFLPYLVSIHKFPLYKLWILLPLMFIYMKCILLTGGNFL